MAGENINRNLNIYINDKQVVNSFNGIGRAINQTRNELKNLDKGTEGYEDEVKRLTKQLKELSDAQEEFKEELQLTSQEMSAARENFENLMTAMIAGDMKAIQAGLMGIRGSIVATSQALWAFVMTPVGAFVATLVGISVATKQWINYNEEVYKANLLTNDLTGLTGMALDNLRVRATTMAETFDQDYKEIINVAKTLVKEFGATYEEALDAIEEGFIKGGSANEEFLESMREYPTFFAAAGYSVSEFQNLVNTGIDLSIYQDKLPDAIKEFTLSVNEQTKGVKDALTNAFGEEFTTKLLSGIKNGSISVKDALALVANEAKRVGLNSQQAQQLTADLFRGAGEDAGGALKIFEAVRQSIENQKRPLTEAEKATKELADSYKELAQAQELALKTDGYDKWKKRALMAVNDIKEAWYTMISGMVNNRDEINKQAKAKGDANAINDEENAFKDYMERRRKRLGSQFNWEKERAEHLADVIARMNSEWRTDVELEAYERQIKVIESAKNPNTAIGSNKLTEDEKKAKEDAAKKRAKELEDAKKHAEALRKQEEELQKQLLASKRQADDIKNQLIREDYERERTILNTEYDRKIEDLQINIEKEQTEITKLRTAIKNPKTPDTDVASFRKQLADRVQIKKIYDSQLVTLEQTRDLKLGSLREKFVKKDIQEQEAENARQLQRLQTKHNIEFSQIKSLETAKAVLKKYLNEDELNKITTLEKAKKEIKKQYLHEEIELQEQALIDMMSRIQGIFEEEKIQGITLLTPEERKEMLKFLDEYSAKLSSLGVQKTENEDPEKKPTGLDLLGYSQEQWEEIFNNFDSLEGRIQAVGMGFIALSNAYSMYSNLMAAGEKRNLQKFEADNRKKQNLLNTQLEKGYITQEVYNARKAKAENELAKKRAELEYKQAKREKMMNIANIIGNTAVGVSKALAQGGLAGIAFGALVAAFGAVQLAAAIKQPLPDKNGYYVGGFTGGGNPRSVSNALGKKDYIYHNGEYVIPNNVLFSNDPVVPNIVGYLENKRTGRQTSNTSDTNPEQKNISSSQSGPTDQSLLIQVYNVLTRNADVLEKIEQEGLVAYLVNDIPAAKKMRDKIKELIKLETNAKA
ncbi:phage tail tape measure protein [Flavobacterium oncorhynchi]|uniref:phage tail tape measure protein n=1 Tax=Flavobacterium oncorhynchi TaxID=728056 RepID=UPI00351AAF02